MRCLCLLALLAFTTADACARETDNYLVWGVELADAGAQINGYLADQIQTALRTQPRDASCEEATFAIAKRLQTGLRYETRIERWAIDNLSAEQIYPRGHVSSNATIHRDPFYFYMNFAEPAPLLQVGGFYFGVDKLSHFGSVGRVYLKKYLQQRRAGASRESALAQAIGEGINQERTFLGLLGSGVYSYADLEANYQGLLFFQRLCLSGELPYLTHTPDTGWRLTSAPNIGEYVSGNWDESYNTPYYLRHHWPGVRRVLREKYCAKAHEPSVVARMEHYRLNSPASFSMLYLAGLRAENSRLTPFDPQQDFTNACAGTGP